MILLQAKTDPSQGLLPNLILFGGILILFYFFMIRPQQQKIKKEKEFRESLKKGDKVVTIGGIHGKIVQIDEKTILLEVDNNVKLLVEKESVKGFSQ